MVSLEGVSSREDTQGEKTVHLHNTEANMAVDMEYTPLKAISVESTNSISVGTQGESYGERCGWDFTLGSTHLIASSCWRPLHPRSFSV